MVPCFQAVDLLWQCQGAQGQAAWVEQAQCIPHLHHLIHSSAPGQPMLSSVLGINATQSMNPDYTLVLSMLLMLILRSACRAMLTADSTADSPGKLCCQLFSCCTSGKRDPNVVLHTGCAIPSLTSKVIASDYTRMKAFKRVGSWTHCVRHVLSCLILK